MATPRDIQSYIRSVAPRGRETERVGPFLATFDPRDDNRHLSYAIPDDGAQPAADDVAGLVEAFRRRARIPRLEFLPAVAPAVEEALLAGGFAVEGRLPVMTSTSPVALDPVDGIALERPAGRDDVRGLLAAQHAAFGVPAPGQDAVDRTLADDGLRVLARDVVTGQVVGGGVATPPADGVSEIAGIGVLASHRRRGIAGAITAWLAAELFASGVQTAFLTPGDDGAHRVYARAGFADTTEILHLSIA